MIALLVVVVLCGLAAWLISMIPIPQLFKNIGYVVIAICLIAYLLRAFGIFHGPDLPVPQLR